MSMFKRLTAWVRLRLVAAQWRSDNANIPLSDGARRCIANHKVRVRAAISRNHLNVADEQSVLNRSNALINAYARGKLASISEATVWTLDLANKLGAAAEMERLYRVRSGTLGHTSIVAR